MLGRSTLLALALLLFLALPALSQELEVEPEGAPATPWQEAQEPRSGVSCMDSCLADGEELFDCEYYCILQAGRSTRSYAGCAHH